LISVRQVGFLWHSGLVLVLLPARSVWTDDNAGLGQSWNSEYLGNYCVYTRPSFTFCRTHARHRQASVFMVALANCYKCFAKAFYSVHWRHGFPEPRLLSS